ncbi:MAG: glycosyltransferase, partial [Flavitalea sp.]
RFDLFLNVSESEGVPVSIMEAMSAGLPVIATNVGGTREIVDGSNGVLVNKNISALELSDLLVHFKERSPEEIKKFRNNSYLKFKEKSEAGKNAEILLKTLKDYFG